jgi:hypothetical protein
MADNIYKSTWTSAANTQVGSYPYINATQTESGHLDLKDDTRGAEAMRRQHGTSGTYEHWYHNGDADTVVKGNNFTVVVRNNNVIIQGICNIEIHGDSKLHVYGDAITQIDGNMQAVVSGDTNIHSDGDIDISSDGDVDISANVIYLNSPSDVIVSGDLRVDGEITCAALSSKTNVTANFKIFGVGGIETLGGINAGFVTPGPVVPPGVITSITSIESPLAVFGVMQSVLMSDVINSAIYDTHVHPKAGVPSIPFIGV